MTRVACDSVEADAIPLNLPQIVWGYKNGRYLSYEALKARFPHIAVGSVDVNGSDPTCDILDVESGDANVGTAVIWVTAKLKLGGFLPILYCNRSTLTPLFNALAGHGYKVNEHFKIIIATLDDTKSVADMTGVVAVQFAGADLTGGHYDESVVYDDSWNPGVVSVPTPPVVSKTIESVTVTFSDGTTSVVKA